jgi:hypothetical protein
MPRLFQRLRFLEAPFAGLQHFWHKIEDFAGWHKATDSSAGSALFTKLFTGTRSFASGSNADVTFIELWPNDSASLRALHRPALGIPERG